MILYDKLTYHPDYKDIMIDMLNDDFYIMQDKDYDYIHTIIKDDKNIGYVACNIEGKNIILELCYIKKEYRGQNIFIKNLKQIQKKYDEYTVCIDLPNKYMINTLTKNNYTTNINEQYIKTNHIKLSFKKDDNRIISDIYDLKNAGVYKNGLISPLLHIDKINFNIQRYKGDTLENI